MTRGVPLVPEQNLLLDPQLFGAPLILLRNQLPMQSAASRRRRPAIKDKRGNPVGRVTREQFEGLKRQIEEERSEGDCPIWPGTTVLMRESAGDTVFAEYLSWRAGGLFRFSAVPSCITDEDTRKRVSSWIWERNATFDALGAEETEEVPKLTPELIQKLAKQQPLTFEKRVDRAVQAIGRPPASLLVPQQYGPQTGDDRLLLFCAATECGDDPAEISGWLREIESEGLIRNQHLPGKTPNYMLSSDGLRRLENGAV